MIGTTLSHYRIVEELGRGGMGVVYLAQDLRLRRSIALKVLREELMRDALRRKRFMQEARAAAAIEDPHLVNIHDVDEDQGHTFIAMEYIRGQSLSDSIKSGELDVATALRLAAEVAEAIGKVHALGIVHRDLKPDNILITETGHAKVIDFGLAKLLESEESKSPVPEPVDHPPSTATNLQTQVGVVMGTARYMSPEQACNSPLDARSDIFSLGVVLFEMVTGQPLFKRGTVLETLSSILHETPTELERLKEVSPPGIEPIVLRALEKFPENRYQSSEAMAAELRKQHQAATAGPRSYRLPLVAGGALVVAIAVLIWSLVVRPPPAPPEAPPIVSVLIADFDNLTGEAVFDGALEQALTIGLEGAPFISSYNRAAARNEASQLNNGVEGTLDARVTQLLCVRQGIKVAILGTINAVGDGYEIHASAVDPVTSETMAEIVRAAPGKDQVLAVVDGIARDLRQELGETGSVDGDALDRETFTASSLEAASSYARGQQLLSLGQYQDARDEFGRTIELDPELGRAYSSLAVVLANTGQLEEAANHFATALSLIDRMTERERLRTRGTYYLATMNYEKAIDEYTNLVDKYPADSSGRSNLALAYFYARDMDRALLHGRSAADFYPLSVPRRNNVALYALYSSDFDVAEVEARHALELNPSYEKAHVALALSQLSRGGITQARDSYRLLGRQSLRGQSLAELGQADTSLFAGSPEEAASILTRQADEQAPENNPTTEARKLVMLARAYVELADNERAADATARAVEMSKQFGVLVAAARIHVAAGNEDAANAIASELEQRLQTDARAYAGVIRGELLLEAGDHHGAITAFQSAQEIADTWLGRFDLGRAYLAAGAPIEAHSELEECFNRRGEATALFLDELPTYHVLPAVHYYLGLALEGMGSAAADDAFRQYVGIRGQATNDSLLADAQRRLGSTSSP